MATQYYCKNERRRAAVRTTKDADGKPILNGIDYLEVSSGDQGTLSVHLIHNLPGQVDGVPPSPAPALTENDVVIEGGVRVRNVYVEFAESSENVLTLRVNTPGDFSTYTLRLVRSTTDPTPPKGFDPQLSEIEFSFKVGCPSEFDCQPVTICPPEILPEPQIDYLAKDYPTFRQLMLDRLSVIMPDWQERNPADLGIALLEVLAYAADYLSYYQDAVATEAYLGTARRRVSVRRHARLLDYAMHDGCNARAWVQVQVNADNVLLNRSTSLLTRLSGQETHIAPDSTAYVEALTQRPQVFETMHDAVLCQAHNEMYFYTWGDEQCCLPKGATRATLRDAPEDHLRLRRGDVLIFEEVRGPHSGRSTEADPAHRHAVRLTRVYPEAELTIEKGEDGKPEPRLEIKKEKGKEQSKTDPLTGQAIVEIEWAPEDALPFPLCLWEVEDPDEPAAGKQPVTVARGNVVLADHGRTIGVKEREELQDPPRLHQKGITHRVPYDDDQARSRPAAEAMKQDPREALPAVELTGDGEVWTPQRDLLNSDRFAPGFVVEMENDGRAALRFGDGVYGKAPAGGVQLRATYRIGNGTAGNVGANAIAHIVANISGITRVRNPMPAQGGTDPESLEEVRLYAPQAFRTQERAVTEADYAAAAERHSEVEKAIATRRWTGSWHTVFITVDRKSGRGVDAEFEDKLRTYLERFRLAGHDLEIEPPRFVSLDIALRVCVAPGYYRSVVKEALLETFSNQDLPDDRRGFFHPDRFTFSQPVYLSQVVAAAMQVPGVLWVDAVRFHRWGRLPLREREEGRIPMGGLEIARLDNDPNAPENGKIEFHMEGGL